MQVPQAVFDGAAQSPSGSLIKKSGRTRTPNAVGGRLTKDTWEKDGQSFHRTKLVVNDTLMLGERRSSGEIENNSPSLVEDQEPSEIPF